jgi:copper homeostasis protein
MSTELEICVFNLASALVAQQAGAQRVELCADPGSGGTTPSLGFIQAARAKLQIQVYAIIRPRGGDFYYSEEEFGIMQADVVLCKQLGCDGVAIGMLNRDGSIDKAGCAKLVELAYPLDVSFDRAFDRAIHPQQALEDIIGIGCGRVLSSGQQPTALQGAVLLRELVLQADQRIIVMPGSGLRAGNILELARATGAEQFHGSARTLVPGTMQYLNPAMNEDLSQIMADKDEIMKMLEELKTYKTE